MTEKEAWIALNLIPKLGARRIGTLVNHFGSALQVLHTSVDDIQRIHGFGLKLAHSVNQASQSLYLEKELRLIKQTGAQVITLNESHYPEILRQIAVPPAILYCLGDTNILNNHNRSISAVGSRRFSHYGLRMTRKICGAAAHCGWTVVSGLALGIDTVAHQTAIEFKGPTIAVLGSGLARVYPQENIVLAKRIINEGGLLISEFPLLLGPDRGHFPMRNRIIAGLSPATVVIEAGLNSGSLITANFANEQGRNVFAVPGPADSPNSQGCHKLIREGAVLTESFDDILEDFTCLPGLKQEKLCAKHEPEDLQLSELEQKIVLIIRNGGCQIETIAEELDSPTGKIFAALIQLETKRVIKALPGQMYELR